jgi:methyltransferase
MNVFYLFIVVIVFQRMLELIIAKQNEKWMKSKGGIEFGKNHYRIMVGIHTFFFLFYIWEVTVFGKGISTSWPILLLLFMFTQAGRVWALTTLGKYWNTKIIVLPNSHVVVKGPYQYVKHPNYVIVTLEFIIIPLLFQAYGTLILFSLLNLWILSIRIPEEERALSSLTEYQNNFESTGRFLPKL